MRHVSGQIYGLIGDPVAHSLSPFIMGRAFGEFDIGATYSATRVAPEELKTFIDLARAVGFNGLNLTYPLKDAVLRFVDETTTAVKAIGASNILKATEAGITAHNSDAAGTALALEQLAGVKLSGKRACVFGAGGAGRAAAYGLLSTGAHAVTFAVRDQSRAEASIQPLRRAFPNKTIYCSNGRQLEDVDIIINATPVGMAGVEAATVIEDDSVIESHHVVFDFVYHPQETPLIKAAKRRGARTVDGLALLVAQAKAGFEFWTGNEFSLAEMYQAVKTQRTEKRS